MRRFLMSLAYIYGWIFVRPRRWFFRRMVGAYRLRLKITKCECYGYSFPNLHWWVLYKTIFRFFEFLHRRAWCRFAIYEGGFLKKTPWYAAFIRRIGETTTGYAISGFECHHCGSPDGCQIELSEDETGENFVLLKTWSVGTPDGTDHCFRGITICPVCGYRDEYEASSL